MTRLNCIDIKGEGPLPANGAILKIQGASHGISADVHYSGIDGSMVGEALIPRKTATRAHLTVDDERSKSFAILSKPSATHAAGAFFDKQIQMGVLRVIEA